MPQLVRYGHQVQVLDNLSRGRREYLQGIRDIEIIEDDICNSVAIEKAVKGVDAVIHLAAFGSVTESVRDPVENFNINVHGTFNVLNACRKSAVSQVIFASTGGALIGNAEPPVNEQSVPRPISPYGSSKL
ncbi:MAG: NAD-dependent epimerase/dehydratase family protein, partial [Candidatus Micrarchaeaceae archaeon]